MADVLPHRRPLPIAEQAQERSEPTATSLQFFLAATIYLQTRSDGFGWQYIVFANLNLRKTPGDENYFSGGLRLIIRCSP